MKFIKNSIDSDNLQVSISDAELEKQMANCDMETEVVNDHCSEDVKSSEKSNMEGGKKENLTNGILGKSESPTVPKCNGKVNGFYEEEEDFNLVLEDSSEETESPLKKIDEDTISAPQIVQEIEDLLGINSSSAGIQEELNNLDGTESIEDNLDDDNEGIEDTNSQETQEGFKEIEEDKTEECKEVDNEKKEITGEVKKLSDKIPETIECDVSSNMNLVFDEVEVGLESEEVQCSNEKKLITDVDEAECNPESSTETNNTEEIKDCDSSETVSKTKAITSQTPLSNVEKSGKTEESVKSTSNEIPLNQISDSFESSEEWMVVDSVETSEEENLSGNQELLKTVEVTSNLSGIEKCSGSESDLKSKIDCAPSEQSEPEIVENSLEAKDTSERQVKISPFPSEGECGRKRSASVENDELELKKPKLEEQSCLVENSSTILKRSSSETTENESKRTKLSETIEESTELLVEDDHVHDESEKFDDNTVESVKEIQIRDESVEENQIRDESVEENQIRDESVEENKIRDESVEENQIRDGSVEENKIRDESVEENQIRDGSVEENQIRDGSVEENKIRDESVEENEIRDGSVEENQIRDESVEENQTTDVPMKDVLVETVPLDVEESYSKHEKNTKNEEIPTTESSRSESPVALCENNDVVESQPVDHQQTQENMAPVVSVKQGSDEGVKIDSESTSKVVNNVTPEGDDPSVIKTLSKQNSDEIVMVNTPSGCEKSNIKSENKIQNCVALKQENISDENKENVSNSIIDGPRQESELDALSSNLKKEPVKLEQVKEISECLTKTETKISKLSTNLLINTELSSSIKELEKSINNKGGHEKTQHSVEPKSSELKKMTNIEFTIDSVVEKYQLQTEKKVPILKKFHKDQLKKLKRSELEEIVVSKICEAVGYKSEIGQMRLRTQNLEEANDMWRKKVQQIEKQNRELEMVVKRFLNELTQIKRENQNKVPMPIKVTRSVGLQVVLASSMHGALVSSRNKINTEPTQQQQQQQVAAKVKPTEKEKEKVKETVKASTFMPPNPTPMARGRGRPAKNQTAQTSRPSTPQSISPKVTPPTTPAKPTNLTPVKTISTPNKDLEVIDLTDKEERAKSASQQPVNGSIRVAPNTQVCFVQQSTASSPPQQPLYLLQKTGQRQQFLVATSSATPQRPMAQLSRPPPALALPVFRAGGHYIPVQTTPVGVKASTTSSPSAVSRQVPSALRLTPQASPVNRHPAPLPTAPAVASKPGMKAPPPKPQLKIAKTSNGIMLSWSMALNKDMAEMQSYQLYAYQEGNQPPSTGLWKKVGDVKALPLPMACTLTQFIEGHKYHFAVRAVDTHGRVGPFSTPSSILLTK